jgi:uncharacterized circularly permuted ATP-grasp superfamily protein/uncharacterized alpha-E superfamily protein
MTSGLSSGQRADPIFACPPQVYNELQTDGGQLRAHWQRFLQIFRSVPVQEFARRNRQAERMLRENGVTYHSVMGGGESARPWRLDLLPMLMGASEWGVIERGLAQRARLLNGLIADIYGSRRLVEQGFVPAPLLYANPEFLRPFTDLHRPGGAPLFLYAAELARRGDGQWCVMADRSEAPAGPGFALENRIVSSRAMPASFKQIPVERLAPFFVRLQNSLRRRVPRPIEQPRTVLLSSGPGHPYYFEDVYLARYLGYTMVEGGDLAVRADNVYMKTLSGLVPVDIILSRCAEAGLDPLELGSTSEHGVPGLLNAMRCGNVTIVNTPGCGITGAPVFMSCLPGLCQHLLGEELLLPSIPTWWCGNPQDLALVLERLPELVLKPAFQKSGGEEILCSELSVRERTEWQQRLQREPWAWVAQEKISRSGVPVWTDSGIRCGHVALRAFLVEDEQRWHLMPGGLIRIAPDAGPMQLSVAGGDSSKDLWVLAEGRVEAVTLLTPQDQPAELRRTTALFPSRVADNLFWLGRALDRCDFLARLVRALAERLAGEGGAEATEIRFLTRALCEQGQLEPGFAVDGMNTQLPALAESLPAAVFDPSDYGGLARSVRDLTRLASLVRDWISPDTWQRVNAAAESFWATPARDWRDLADVVAASSALIGDCASISGLIADGMNRGPSWRFLELGRSIERAAATARLLITADLRRAAGPPLLRTLIEVLDVRMTYRFRYRENLQRNAVLDLAITDETNPRSLAFQVERLVQHVDRLPGIASQPLRSADMRLVMEAAHAIRMLTAEDLSSGSLKTVLMALKTVEDAVLRLSDTLTSRYLVHSGNAVHAMPGRESV